MSPRTDDETKGLAKVVRLSEIDAPRSPANRPLDRSWVDYLVKHWDQSLVGVPLVAAFGDRYRIINGQHRIEAMREMNASDVSVLAFALDDLPPTLLLRMLTAEITDLHQDAELTDVREEPVR